MTAHPKVQEFKRLVSLRSHSKHRSTENIFTTWAAASKAAGVTQNTMWRWSKFLPPLPITRQYLEQWMLARGIAPVRILTEVLRYRLVLQWPDPETMKALKINKRVELYKWWKNALKRYDKVKPPGVPDTVEEALVLWRRLKSERASVLMKIAQPKGTEAIKKVNR